MTPYWFLFQKPADMFTTMSRPVEILAGICKNSLKMARIVQAHAKTVLTCSIRLIFASFYIVKQLGISN